MDITLRDQFVQCWQQYVPGATLPIAFFYADEPGDVPVAPSAEQHACFLAQLGGVRQGESIAFARESLGCFGGKRYLGFDNAPRPGFEYFLSCGIPGKMEGERYKKSPELVLEFMTTAPTFVAPARYIVLKRWDTLEAGDEPAAVFFEAKPDVLACLFTLANYDQATPYGVITPFCAGCGAVVTYPYLEGQSEQPRATIGMFDISARPWFKKDALSFAVPMNKFAQMIANMNESFLITRSWERVKNRL